MIKAAGVLPYTKDKYGHIWFLLGREKPNANWANDSSSWSEFGGSINAGETPEEGAAREFFEETMGTVFGNKCWMENELKCGRYLFAMDSRTPSGKGYRSFVKYIPFIDYPKKFARYRTMSKKQPELFAKIAADCFHLDGRIQPSCIEKTSIGWFSLDTMIKAVARHKEANGAIGVVPNAKLPAYYEPEGIPHIRTGFAIDFEHLLGTTWAKAGFTNDEYHFPSPRRWGASPPLSISGGGGSDGSGGGGQSGPGGQSNGSPPLVGMSSSPPPTLVMVVEERPIIRTPQYTDRPITPHVPSTRQGIRRNPPTLIVEGGLAYKKRKRNRKAYKPTPPIF